MQAHHYTRHLHDYWVLLSTHANRQSIVQKNTFVTTVRHARIPYSRWIRGPNFIHVDESLLASLEWNWLHIGVSDRYDLFELPGPSLCRCAPPSVLSISFLIPISVHSQYCSWSLQAPLCPSARHGGQTALDGALYNENQQNTIPANRSITHTKSLCSETGDDGGHVHGRTGNQTQGTFKLNSGGFGATVPLFLHCLSHSQMQKKIRSPHRHPSPCLSHSQIQIWCLQKSGPLSRALRWWRRTHRVI